jgi:hypothetical protein
MRRALVIATAVAATWAGVAAADGVGPSPGESFGWDGVVGPSGAHRFVAVPANRGTVVETVGVRGGRVLNSRFLKGYFGIPMVAYDGSTDGLSHNGRRLVLVSHGARTTFLVLDPSTLKTRAQIHLPGYWAFDALSPGGSLLYLIQYQGGPNANGQQAYAVRALNLNTRSLYADAIVDRREPDEKMTGSAQTRTESRDGRWAYTLYTRPSDHPFVHALDTVGRRAFCVDLPWKPAPWISSVRMKLRGGELLLQRKGRTLARMDTQTFVVSR